MILIKSLSFSILVIALSVAASSAQNVRKIAFRTLCLERLAGMEKVAIPGKVPPELQEFELFTDVSPVIEGVFATGEALFYIQKPPGLDGKPIHQLVGRGPLAKSNRQLFLFSPGEGGEGKLPYQIWCFDDDTTNFPMGNVRAINLSPVPVRFILSGKMTPEIPPAKHAYFPHSKKFNDYNMYPVVVEFLSGNGRWVKGQSVSWKATDRRREIVVTLIDPRFKQPSVRMYSDFPPWLETPPTAVTP